MSILLSTSFANSLLAHGGAGVADQVGGGTLIVYSGTPPAGPNEALSGNTALGTWNFQAGTAQGTPAGGSMTLVFALLSVTCAAAGTPAFFRIASSSGAALIQGTAGLAGSDMVFTGAVPWAVGDTLTIAAGPSVSWTVT